MADDFDDLIPDISALTTDGVPWPQKGDKLFISTGSALEAHVASGADERLYHIMNGYKTAADLLVGFTEKWPGYRRRLVYPIVFCYRHYLEITLKGLIIAHGPSVNIGVVEKNHNLLELWRTFRSIVVAHGQGNADYGNDIPLDSVEENIKEFAAIDPASMTFRYHADRKDKPFEGVPHSLDLAELKRVMENIWMLFEAVDTALDATKAGFWDNE